MHITLDFQLPDICQSVSYFNINILCSVFKCNNSFFLYVQQISILIPELTWIPLLLTQSIVVFLYLKFMNSTPNSYIIHLLISELLFLSIMHEAEYSWYLTELDWLTNKKTQVLFVYLKEYFIWQKVLVEHLMYQKYILNFKNWGILRSLTSSQPYWRTAFLSPLE